MSAFISPSLYLSLRFGLDKRNESTRKSVSYRPRLDCKSEPRKNSRQTRTAQHSQLQTSSTSRTERTSRSSSDSNSRSRHLRSRQDRETRKAAGLLYLQAQTYANDGKFSEARHAFEKLTQEFSADGRYWLGFAQMEARSGNTERARELFRAGAESNNRSQGHLLHAWAVLEERTGNCDRARKLFRRCIAINRNDVLAYQALALLEERSGDTQRAIELFEKAAELPAASRHAAFWNAYGVVQQKRNEYESACQCFQRATSIDPEHFRSWQAWAISEERLGEIDTAVMLFEKALTIDPHSAPSFQAYGLCEARRGNIDKARKLFKCGITACPSHAPLFHAWALLEERAGNFELARALFEQGVRADSENAVVLRSWAQMELRLGHIDRSSSSWNLPFLPERKVRRGQLSRYAEKMIIVRRLIEHRTKEDLKLVLTWLGRAAEKDKRVRSEFAQKSSDETSKLLQWAQRRSKQDIEAFEQWFEGWYEKDRRIVSYIFGWNIPKRASSGITNKLKIPTEWYTLSSAPRKTLREADDEFFNDNAVEYTLIAEFFGTFATNLSNRMALSCALLGISGALVFYAVHAGLYDIATEAIHAHSPQPPSGVDAHLIELHGTVNAENVVDSKSLLGIL
uniref:Uncharacterized protein n=1 Tax=Timspurckia oligopyrenoides TaxID=708627 RepID=A0A7S0ZAL8_9RHOD|mmetsp:Transcript_10412/g.18781  ORF Transcript_10412/g.18781 Transcript_10412/m.18781 type:complete len:627 (+) Transcript_10412:330-2210(+)